MKSHEFLIKKASLDIWGFYRNFDGPRPWYYTLNFTSGKYRCKNAYGIHTYTLSNDELVAFEKEIIDSHALEWDPRGISDGLDGRSWTAEFILADGTKKDFSGNCSYRYNYLKLEHVFVFTEQRLRGGPLDSIDYLENVRPDEWVDLEEAKKKYPEEFTDDTDNQVPPETEVDCREEWFWYPGEDIIRKRRRIDPQAPSQDRRKSANQRLRRTECNRRILR